MWPSAPGQAIAEVKGQCDGKQRDLNLSEETSEEVFAGGFHSTCCPVTSSAGTETCFILFMETFIFFPQKNAISLLCSCPFFLSGVSSRKNLGYIGPKVNTVSVS